MFSTERAADQEVEEGKYADMEGVEHLGQYVFEMTGAKVKALKEGAEVLPAIEEGVQGEDVDEDGPVEAVEAEDDAEDVYDEEEGPSAPGGGAVDT